MKTILTLSLSLSLALAVQAQLAPQKEATLYRHMVEVNAQWAQIDPALASDTKPVHFANEAERIAEHLHLVAAYLRSHSPEGLSAEAVTKRATLLNDLEHYADRGLFPQNHVLPCRNPVFIDPYGTACAVGQLMIESGHRDLAEDINKEMNLAYVHDMKRADVLQWAVQEGFTEDELAWIQPGYPPTTQWTAPDGGTNGTVNVLLGLPDGTLLVAGDFSSAGGLPMNNVAVWNGTAYSSLDNGVSGAITCGAVMDGTIYLGGSSINGTNDLAEWDGTQWSFTSVFQGKFPLMFALHVQGDTLFAAGEIQGFAGSDGRVAYKTAIDWQLIPGSFNAPVRCLGTHDGQLVAGGEFTGITIGDPVLAAEHVAILHTNGWAQLGDGLDGPVRALLNVDDTLYAGGAMIANIAILFGLARLSPSSALWEPLMPNLSNYLTQLLGPVQVNALAWDGEHVFVGGSFEIAGLNLTQGKHLIRFGGEADLFEPLAFFDAPVNAVCANPLTDAHSLFAGGEFTANLGDNVPYIAETSFTTRIHEEQGLSRFTLAPNPAEDHLVITLASTPKAPGTLEILDPQGRIVLRKALSSHATTLDISGLSTGSYLVRTAVDGTSSTAPLIKR